MGTCGFGLLCFWPTSYCKVTFSSAHDVTARIVALTWVINAHIGAQLGILGARSSCGARSAGVRFAIRLSAIARGFSAGANRMPSKALMGSLT